MKTNAIIRIISFSLGILLLAGALLTGIGIHLFTFDGSSHTITHTAQRVEGSSYTADPTQIKNIEIDWAAGTILIEPSQDVDDIRIMETDVEEKYRMVCTESGSTLTIRFSRDSTGFISFGTNSVSKDLVIQVPAGWICQTLEIDVAAADVDVKNLTIRELDFDGASGLCNLENCHVTDLDVDAASGDLCFSGTLDTLDFDGASADCTLNLTACPSHIALDGMSGKLDIILPSDCGFTVSTGGLSSKFSTDFETTTRNGAHVHGDGSCRIEIDALSGSVAIHDGGYQCHSNGENDTQSHHDIHR